VDGSQGAPGFRAAGGAGTALCGGNGALQGVVSGASFTGLPVCCRFASGPGPAVSGHASSRGERWPTRRCRGFRACKGRCRQTRLTGFAARCEATGRPPGQPNLTRQADGLEGVLTTPGNSLDSAPIRPKTRLSIRFPPSLPLARARRLKGFSRLGDFFYEFKHRFTKTLVSLQNPDAGRPRDCHRRNKARSSSRWRDVSARPSTIPDVGHSARAKTCGRDRDKSV
jgi:hypothetical protein